MLATLHVAAFRGVADPWARALLLVHLGLLLLWQPFLRAEQRISPMQGFILSLVAFVVMMALDWWLLAFWVVVLADSWAARSIGTTRAGSASPTWWCWRIFSRCSRW